MLLPLHDRTPVVHIRFQVVTSAIIVACILAFIWQLSLPASEEGEIAIFRLAFVPARLFGLEDGSVRPDILWGLGSIATSMFLHAGLGHIFGNMLFLWVFGDNIEDAMGHTRFIVFYLICGAVAAFAQAFTNIHDVAPMIGASGAISGVLGAYLVLHPHTRILVMTVFFITFRMRAVWLIGLWIAYQLFLGLLDDGSAMVAWWAHIGGFAAGATLIPIFRRRGVPLFDRADTSVAAAVRPRRTVARLPVAATVIICLAIAVILSGFWMFELLSMPLALVILGFSIYLFVQNLRLEVAHGRKREDRSENRGRIAEDGGEGGSSPSAPAPRGRSVIPPTARRRR